MAWNIGISQQGGWDIGVAQAGAAAPSTVAYRPAKGKISGYNCFMAQYIDYTNRGISPLKLPDGTLW